MSEKRKKRRAVPWVLMTGYLLIGAACGLLMVIYLEHLYADGAEKSLRLLHFGLLFLCMYGAMLAQLILHEAGHLVFGLMTGYRFQSFRIFNVMLLKTDGGMVLRRLSLAGTGGQCLMCPPDLKEGKMPVMLYNFGGALMNLITALIFGIIAMMSPAWTFGWLVLLFLVIIGIAFAVMNGLPLGTGQVNNDGKNALDLSRNPEAMRAFWIQMKANEQISRGIRVRDMPAEWFEVPSEESMKNGIIATVGVLACSRLMDEERFEEADALMERLMKKENGIVGLHRSLMTCDRMFIEMIGQNSREVLDRMMTKEQGKIMKAMKTYPSVLRTEYARALLQDRDAGKAEAVRKQFERCAAAYPYPSETEGERELMAIAEERARELQADKRTSVS